MEREYIVSGKLTDGSEFEDRIMARNRDEALLITLENWRHHPDGKSTSFTEMYVSTTSDKIDKLEDELRSSKQIGLALFVVSVILAFMTMF